MGSGKSTTGKDLAKALGFEFIDLDDFIEQKYQTKISEIFEKEGELGFRKKEREALKEVLTSTNIVLSLGGGTPVYFDNMNEIDNNSISFFTKFTNLSNHNKLIYRHTFFCFTITKTQITNTESTK